jgi:hypothetical protein
MIGRSTMSGVHSSILRSGVVVLPWVAVEVHLPLDLEVVIPWRFRRSSDFGFWIQVFQPFSLCCTSPLPVKFSWIIHKRKFGFLGEVANHLQLGLAIKQKSKKRKVRVNQN